jgi:two-component system NtrC family response regulator
MNEGAKAQLLVVEDDVTTARQLRWSFDSFDVELAGNRDEALEVMARCDIPVVLLDLGLPPDPEGSSEGLLALEQLLEAKPGVKVIVVTGRQEHEVALQAVELGAYDFQCKPVERDQLAIVVDRALAMFRLEEENRLLRREASERVPLPGIIAHSESMLAACRLVERAAPSDISVLFTGESGVGKEVLCNALHQLSPRAQGPMVAINCAAIPDNLLESELFGHERGAFTGADRQVKGRIELARGGTLFLDEIGDMPAPLQAKVLRYLQERVIQRVGGREEITVDARIVSATHRDLAESADRGSFREDLYYRLSQFTIDIPPLRDRPEDIVLLAQHFLERFVGEAGRTSCGLSGDAISALVRYEWPGNVRELESTIRRSLLMAEGERVTSDDLGLALPEQEGRPGAPLKSVLAAAERIAVTRAWAAAAGNVSLCAKELGVSRPTLYRLLRDHGLKE